MQDINHYYLISLLTDYFGSDKIAAQYYTFGAVAENKVFDITLPSPKFESPSDNLFISDSIYEGKGPLVCIDSIGGKEVTDDYTSRLIADDDIDLKEWYEKNKDKDIDYNDFESLWTTGPFITDSIVICDNINSPINRMF